MCSHSGVQASQDYSTKLGREVQFYQVHISSVEGQETVLARFVQFFWGRGSLVLGLWQVWLEGVCDISQ